jgi:uncharacterized protein YaaN involved in tellurite resistance
MAPTKDPLEKLVKKKNAEILQLKKEALRERIQGLEAQIALGEALKKMAQAELEALNFA